MKQLKKDIEDEVQDTIEYHNQLGDTDKEKAIKLVYKGQLDGLYYVLRKIAIKELDINMSKKEYQKAVREITKKYMR